VVGGEGLFRRCGWSLGSLRLVWTSRVKISGRLVLTARRRGPIGLGLDTSRVGTRALAFRQELIGAKRGEVQGHQEALANVLANVLSGLVGVLVCTVPVCAVPEHRFVG
jgi:hypothetical protein